MRLSGSTFKAFKTLIVMPAELMGAQYSVSVILLLLVAETARGRRFATLILSDSYHTKEEEEERFYKLHNLHLLQPKQAKSLKIRQDKTKTQAW